MSGFDDELRPDAEASRVVCDEVRYTCILFIFSPQSAILYSLEKIVNVIGILCKYNK